MSYISSIFGFLESPGLWTGLQSAAEIALEVTGKNPLSFNHPSIDALSYWGKVRLLWFATIPVYVAFAMIAIIVAILGFGSRLIPDPLKRVVHAISVILAMLPFIVLSFFMVVMICYSYYLAWPKGSGTFFDYVDFAIFVFLFPFVVAHILTPAIGEFIFAVGVVPYALLSTGKDTFPNRFIKHHWI